MEISVTFCYFARNHKSTMNPVNPFTRETFVFQGFLIPEHREEKLHKNQKINSL